MSGEKWDYGVFWKEACNQLREEVSEQEWVMWFENIRYDHSTEKDIIVSVPSAFFRDQVKQRYLSQIERKIADISGHSLKLGFTIKKGDSAGAPGAKDSSAPGPSSSGSSVPAPSAQASSERPSSASSPPAPQTRKARQHPNLKEDYVFDTFVIGENNSFAANAAFAIAKNPGTAYNPCLIYGGVGLGKTHLIQSIGNLAFQEFENRKIVYVTAEQFTNEFIQAIKDKKNHLFKNKYRGVDILLIDDIHFLQNKTETQEELFHTFNALYDANKQMVFTCDRPVSELKQLTDRLRSRFERGLNVDLQPPNYETRYAILKKKIESTKVSIPDEVIEIICKNITTNVRDLEAALTKLIAYADLVNKNITLEIAQKQLKDVFSSPKSGMVTIEIIQRVVADYFSLSYNDLRGKKRTKAIAFPRQIAMYITRELTEYSTTEIGDEFGGRDHTTVMHAFQRVEIRLKSDPTTETIINNLIRMVKEYKLK